MMYLIDQLSNGMQQIVSQIMDGFIQAKKSSRVYWTSLNERQPKSPSSSRKSKMKFHVTLPSGDNIEVTLKPGENKGLTLINTVYSHLNIPEDSRKYFGINYGDKYDGGTNWIREDDDLRKINAMRYSDTMHVAFTVRILPKDPHLNFSSAEIRRLIRHHLKSLMLHDILRCDVETSAKLDGYIIQAEIGNHELIGREKYTQHLERLDIYLPIYIISSSPITEHEYHKKVQVNHRKCKDMTPAKADILFLNTVQNIQSYGHVWYKISDPIHKRHFISLSSNGVGFVYEDTREKAVGSEKREAFSWNNVENCEVDNKTFRLTLSSKLTNIPSVERKFKMKSRYSYKDAARLRSDIDRYKHVYCEQDKSLFNSLNVQPTRAKTEKTKSKSVSRLSSFTRSFRKLGSSKKRRNSEQSNCSGVSVIEKANTINVMEKFTSAV